MIYKEIYFPVEIKSLIPVSNPVVQEVFTNDTNCIELHYEVMDMISLEGMTPQIVLFMQDGSIYQITSGIVIDGLHVRYALPIVESNHIGYVRTQLSLRQGDVQLSSQVFTYKVVSGLMDKVPVQVHVANWTTLTSEILNFIGLVETNEQTRLLAESQRVLSELSRDSAELSRAEIELIRKQSESARTNAEAGRVQAEGERVIAERLRNSNLFEALIGDRNYLRNSRTTDIRSVDETLKPITTEILVEGSKKFVRVKRANVGSNPGQMTLYNNIPYPDFTVEIRGKVLYASFLVRASEPVEMTLNKGYLNTDTLDEVLLPNRPNLLITDKWRLIFTEIAIPMDVNLTFLRFSPFDLLTANVDMETFYLDICEWKVSTSRSPWSPAPEDLVEATRDDSIAMISSSIENLSIFIEQGNNDLEARVFALETILGDATELLAGL